MSSKFELTTISDGTKNFRIYRIRALKDFTLVDGTEIHAGQLGGWVENENNLSQEGSCWIDSEAWVLDNSVVKDNAYICGRATIEGGACVSGNAKVSGKARIGGGVTIKDNATVGGNTWVYHKGEVGGNATLFGNADISLPEDCASFAIGDSTITFFRVDDGEKVDIEISDPDGKINEFADIVNSAKSTFVKKMEAAHREDDDDE